MIYKSFFGFRAKPFNEAPELRFHYVTHGYAENFNTIRKSIRQQQGLNTLVGETGTGKTLFLERLISASRNQGIHYIRCTNADTSLPEIVDLICESLDLLAVGKPELEKRQWIQASLVERYEQGQLFVLAIDDAHEIPDRTLRDLLDFHRDQDIPVLQIILIGRPSLEGKVISSAASLGIEVGTICHLDPPSKEDIPNYIDQQLRAAGYQGTDIFLPDAIERIAHFASGSLRELSLLCDAALVVAHLHASREVNAAMIDEAAQQHSINVAAESAVDESVPDPVPEADQKEKEAEAFLRQLAAEQNGAARPDPALQTSDATADPRSALPTDPAGTTDEQPMLFTPEHGKASKSVFSLPLQIAALIIVLIAPVAYLTLHFLDSDNSIDPGLATDTAAVNDTQSTHLASATDPQNFDNDRQLVDNEVSDPVAALTPPDGETHWAEDQAEPIVQPTDPQFATAANDPPLQADPTVDPTLNTDPVDTAMHRPIAEPSSSGIASMSTNLDSTPISVPDYEGSNDPQVRILLRLAGAQIRSEQFISPKNDNALETFLEILKIAPNNRTALTSLQQINDYFFDQVATAQQTRALFEQQAANARREQQRYLDQFAIAKQEKEAYLKDINSYYLGQAILANRYKVNSLIEAEVAHQNTQEYLESLAGQLFPGQVPRQSAPTAHTPSTLTAEQTALASDRVERLLHRAEQQIQERRLLKPSRNSALSSYQQVLELDPSNERAINGIEFIMNQYLDWAAAAAAQSRLQQARYFFEQAVGIDPGNLNLAGKIREVRQLVTVTENAIAQPTEVIDKQNIRPTNLNHSPELSEALLESARLGDASSVSRLLSSGASPDTQDLRGNTALMVAAQGGHSEVIGSLLKRGAKPNRYNGFGETALMLAAAAGKSHSVQMLLANGASPHARDSDGRTALANAAAAGHIEVAKLLIEHGAEAGVRSKTGRTALMAAAWQGHQTTVHLLLTKFPTLDINERNNDGWTALSHAAWQGHTDVVELLLRNGAAPNIPNNEGITALNMASRRGHDDIVRILQ